MKLIAPYNIPGISNASLQEALDWLDTVNRVGFDIETTAKPEYLWYDRAGLDPYTTDVAMIQIGNQDAQFVIDARFVDCTPIIRRILKNDIRIVGTNLKFDYKHIFHKYDIRLTKMYDIMLSEMILQCGTTSPKGFYGLRGMAERYLDIDISKEVRSEFRELGMKPFTYDQVAYGAQDVVLPLLIAEYQLERIKITNLHECIKLEHRFLPVLSEIELNGIHLDIDMWMENEQVYHKILDDTYKDLVEEVNSLHPAEYESLGDVNWDSPKQVAELFTLLKIPVDIVDEKNSTDVETVYKKSVGANHLKKYKYKYPIVKSYLAYKELKKLVTSYGEKFLQDVNPVTGRVHSNFYQILATGRISSSKPNMQNIPNEEKREGFRNCFVAPEQCNMVVADYSAQEGRILADRSQEPAMLEFFKSGDGDIHSFVARNMFKCEVSKTVNPLLRQKGKITNFTIAYGGGAHKIADTFQISIKEAQGLIKMYYEAFPGLKRYFKEQQDLAKARGYILIDTITNRRSYDDKYIEYKQVVDSMKSQGVQVPADIWAGYTKRRASLERNAQNYCIQGTGGSMTKLGAILFWERTIQAGLDKDVKIVVPVHDELVVQSVNNHTAWAARTIQESMEEAGAEFVKLLPMPADAKISNYWTH